jgi:hypothetical protein
MKEMKRSPAGQRSAQVRPRVAVEPYTGGTDTATRSTNVGLVMG